MLPLPGTAVTLPKVQVPPRPFGLAMVMAPGITGRVSVKMELRVMAALLLLPRVMLSWESPPEWLAPGLKLLLTLGGVTSAKLYPVAF